MEVACGVEEVGAAPNLEDDPPQLVRVKTKNTTEVLKNNLNALFDISIPFYFTIT